MSGGKGKLSKHLRQMKFMQRTGAQKIDEDEKKQAHSQEHWTFLGTPLPEPALQHVQEPSVCELMNLKLARFSYRGANPAIEKLMTKYSQELNSADSLQREKKGGVSDDEMAKRFESLSATIAKKFAEKRKREEVGEQREMQEGEGDKTKKKKKNTGGKRGKPRQFMKPRE